MNLSILLDSWLIHRFPFNLVFKMYILLFWDPKYIFRTRELSVWVLIYLPYTYTMEPTDSGKFVH